LQSLRDQFVESVGRQLSAAEPLSKWAWELKMMARSIKLGLPLEPWTPLTGDVGNWERLHSVISSELDSFAYNYSELVKKHKEISSMPLNWDSFKQWVEIQKAVSALGKEKSLIVARLRDADENSVAMSSVKVVSSYWKTVHKK
jgi:hypothetical protein